MGRLPRTITVTMLLLSVASTDATGQRRDLREENKRRDQALSDPGRYREMIDAYRAGDTARSVDLLLDPEWDEIRLKGLLAYLDHTPGQPDTTWHVGPMLHIDVALRLSPTLDEDAEQAALHLYVAGELIRLGVRARGDVIKDFAERLYVAVARLLQDSTSPYSAEMILRTARQRLPARASILGASGTLAELFATDYALVGRVSIEPTNRNMDRVLEEIRRRRVGYLNAAEEWLRQAVARSPGDEMLRLHLGRVLALQSDDEEALAILNAVHAATTDDATAYLAAMFVGGLRERQGRLDDAATMYRAARARFPRGHAAAIALSEVLQRNGRGDESREALHDVLTEKLGPAREPLWWYHFDPPGLALERLEALRQEVRR